MVTNFVSDIRFYFTTLDWNLCFFTTFLRFPGFMCIITTYDKSQIYKTSKLFWCPIISFNCSIYKRHHLIVGWPYCTFGSSSCLFCKKKGGGGHQHNKKEMIHYYSVFPFQSSFKSAKQVCVNLQNTNILLYIFVQN